eukprot:5925750-Prymnesium_polylepis.3
MYTVEAVHVRHSDAAAHVRLPQRLDHELCIHPLCDHRRDGKVVDGSAAREQENGVPSEEAIVRPVLLRNRELARV